MYMSYQSLPSSPFFIRDQYIPQFQAMQNVRGIIFDILVVYRRIVLWNVRDKNKVAKINERKQVNK